MSSGPELNALFPIGSVFVIKEPIYKTAATGPSALIRVDSATDIVFLSPGDPLYSTNWKLSLPSSPPTPPSDFKAAGNASYSKKQYRGAIKMYSDGLKATPPPDVQLLLHLDRSAAHLALNQFRACHRDATRVLELIETGTPGLASTKEKALNCIAKAETGMRLFSSALQSYARAFDESPGHVEANRGVEDSQKRWSEAQNGDYDWLKLYKDGLDTSSHPRLDVADFVGPVFISNVPECGGGRGVFSVRDIKAGELLLVKKLSPSNTRLPITSELLSP